ncbi:MAG: hypothetical protein HYT03_00355 [Candidatus Harrisonbacteria bacterium]|nr:hypothetical protein [Candidatus Harrisonbacteria bacterium]
MEITIEKYDGSGGPIPCHLAWEDKCPYFAEYFTAEDGHYYCQLHCQLHKEKLVVETKAA